MELIRNAVENPTRQDGGDRVSALRSEYAPSLWHESLEDEVPIAYLAHDLHGTGCSLRTPAGSSATGSVCVPIPPSKESRAACPATSPNEAEVSVRRLSHDALVTQSASSSASFRDAEE